MNFDEHWRIESIKIAVKEQLESWGELKLDVLFTRAKMIYDLGYDNDLDKWVSDKEQDKRRVAPQPELTPKTVNINGKKAEVNVPDSLLEGHKKCPSCGEQVPTGWTKHSYKKDASICGYEFKEK